MADVSLYTIKAVKESNRIEGITWEPPYEEYMEFDRFVALPQVTIKDLQTFVSVCQPGAELRERVGMNVQVGQHIPLAGGPVIRSMLEDLLLDIEGISMYEAHVRYETLHPFMDGNGRSGRALWHWQMNHRGHRSIADARGFLHAFYYQALAAPRRR